MDWVEALDGKLVPQAAIAIEKRPPLLGDVLERPTEVSDVSSDEENAEGYFSLPRGPLQHDLSPFGLVYHLLDRLISPETVRKMKTGKMYTIPSSDLGSPSCDIQDKLLSSVGRIASLLGGDADDMQTFVRDLCPTFQGVVVAEDSDEVWMVVALTFLESKIGFDMEELESRVLKPFGLNREKYEALKSVFDEGRFESRC